MSEDQTASTGISDRSSSGKRGWQAVVRVQLNQMWGLIALPITFINDTDAIIFSEHSANITEAIIRIAETKPVVKKFLLQSSENMLYGELVMSIVPIVVLICVNHKILPPIMAFPFGGMPKQNDDTNGNDVTINFSDILQNGMASGGTPHDHRTNGER